MLEAEDMHALSLGLEAFEAGDYYAAHEHWELVWKRVADPERRFIQGLIQLATALYKLGQARPEGARKLCARAAPKLADAPPHLHDIDLHAARAHVQRLASMLESSPAEAASSTWSIRARARGPA